MFWVSFNCLSVFMMTAKLMSESSEFYVSRAW